MKAYKTYLTVTDAKQVILSDLPFGIGEKVEVLVLALEDNRAERVRNLRALFKETQSLPQTQTLSDDDIRHEIEAYRSGQ